MICMYLTNDWLLFAFAPREGGVDAEELRRAVRGLGMSNVCHAVGRDMVEGEEQSNDESIGTTGMMIHRQPGLHLAPPGPCGPAGTSGLELRSLKALFLSLALSAPQHARLFFQTQQRRRNPSGRTW